MADAAVHGARVPRDRRGRARRAPRTRPGPLDRSWNAAFPAVYRLDLSALHTPGRYRVVTSGGVRARSPWFRVRLGRLDLRHPPGRRGRPSTATSATAPTSSPARCTGSRPTCSTARASVYAWPHMQRGSDLITDRDLHRIGGPVDVEGGWFDAGDYLKFTHSTAYADVLLFTSARLLGRRTPAPLLAEARYGLRWLSKMWRPRTHTLLIQVGIGSGNKAGTFRGDHDGWRLPEADDARHQPCRPLRLPSTRLPGRRPRATPISPNLVGRVSAAFALAAQRDAAHHRGPRAPRAPPRRRRSTHARPPQHPAAPLGDRTPPRLLPRVELARRHAARRGRDRARPAPARPRRLAATSPTALASPTPSSAAPSPTPSTSTTPGRSPTPRWPTPCGPFRTARSPSSRARPGRRPRGPDQARHRPCASGPVRGLRAGRRVRRQLPHLRAGRDGRPLRRADPHPPVPGVREPAAHLAAGRRPLGRHLDGRHRPPLPAVHAAPGRQPVGHPRRHAPARRRRRRERPQRQGQLRRAVSAASRTACATAPPTQGLRQVRRAPGPLRRRRALVADRRAGARHDRSGDHRRRGTAAAPPARPRGRTPHRAEDEPADEARHSHDAARDQRPRGPRPPPRARPPVAHPARRADRALQADCLAAALAARGRRAGRRQRQLATAAPAPGPSCTPSTRAPGTWPRWT